MSEEPEYNPMTSPKRDLEKLGKNSQAVVGELRQFLATLKGKSPKEMMGTVADSSLAQSMLLATALMAILVVALTAVPYVMKESEAETEEWEKLIWSKERKERSQEIRDGFQEIRDRFNTALTQEGSVPSSDQTGSQPNVSTDEKASGSAQSTADKIGIGEEKKADPNANPLDSKDDDLLDGLDDL